MEEKLIITVCNHRELYDPSLYFYKDRKRSDFIWRNISRDIGVPDDIMTSSSSETNLCAELKHLSLKVEQLEERKKILCIFQELRKRAEFGQTEETAATEQEIKSIDKKLKELGERRVEIQQSYENILNCKDAKSKNEITAQTVQPGVDEFNSSVYYVEIPPSYPAPTVILDVKHLPPHPSRTQCPECLQFVTTETFSSVSSMTWLVCLMSAMIGCVAGCCLIPFCSDKFKSITHRCPKCRTSIITIKKL